MSTWDVTDQKYYSGQGAVLMGQRNSDGSPAGLGYVGNVSALKISIATSVLEHKESHTGQRGTDKRLTTELKVTLSATMENYVAKELARALRGSATNVAAATITDKAVALYAGYVSGLGTLRPGAVVLKQGVANTLTLWVNDTTPWDYKLNSEGGSVYINDGSVTATDKLGIVPTAIAVGATTSITVPAGHGATVGATVIVRGATGADAADINGLPFAVTAVASTTITISLVSTGKTLTTAAGTRMTYDGMPATWSGTNPAQKLVNSLDSPAKELYMRFEGLNTVENNEPVVVEVFKFSTDPLKELDLISDGIQQFVLEGSVLADSLRASGSQYFSVLSLA